jgi:hypothetical protein
MPTTRPGMRVFIVNTGDVPTLHASRIEAAYYGIEDGFMTFKDADHKAVYTVRPDHLVSIERAHDTEPVMAAFEGIMRQAAETGHAKGVIRAPRPIGRNGSFYTDEFDVTVAARDCSDAAAPNSVAVSVQGVVPSEGDLVDAPRKDLRRGDGPVRAT